MMMVYQGGVTLWMRLDWVFLTLGIACFCDLGHGAGNDRWCSTPKVWMEYCGDGLFCVLLLVFIMACISLIVRMVGVATWRCI